jgi:hypothetical protein
MTPIPLCKSDRNTKILITLFLSTLLTAMAVAELNVYDKVGRFKKGIAVRYGPEFDESDLSARNSVDSRSLPSESEMPVSRMNTFSMLLDITHSHIFEIPLVMFVLAHFLMRSRVPEWFKLLNYVGSFGGVVVFLSAPWMVRYVSVRTAPLLYVGAITMGLTALLMTGVPIWDMWAPVKKRQVTVQIQSRVSPISHLAQKVEQRHG